jgi:hypothetical protein
MRRHGIGIVTLVAAVLLLHGGAVVGQDKVKTKKHKDQSSDGVGAVRGACIGSAAGAVVGAASVGMSTCSGQTSSCSPGTAGCCAGVDCGASAMKPDQKLADELVKILNETQSSETFFVTLQCLMHTKANPDVAVPVIIRNADRLRLMKGFFDHSEKTPELEMIAKALKHFTLVSNGQIKTVKKKSRLPTPPDHSPMCEPVLGGSLLPAGHYLEHPPQYFPPTMPPAADSHSPH